MQCIDSRGDDDRRADPCPRIGKLAEDQKPIEGRPDQQRIMHRRDDHRIGNIERLDHQVSAKAAKTAMPIDRPNSRPVVNGCQTNGKGTVRMALLTSAV